MTPSEKEFYKKSVSNVGCKSSEKSLEIPKIIRTIKFNFSVNISEEYIHSDISKSAKQRGEKGIWQRRYYDHIIRNEQDLLNIILIILIMNNIWCIAIARNTKVRRGNPVFLLIGAKNCTLHYYH